MANCMPARMGYSLLLFAVAACSGSSSDELQNNLGTGSGKDAAPSEVTEADAEVAVEVDAAADDAGVPPDPPADAASEMTDSSSDDASAPLADASVDSGLPTCATGTGAVLSATLRATADDYVRAFFNEVDLQLPQTLWSSEKSAQVSVYLDPGQLNVLAIAAENVWAQADRDRGMVAELAYSGADQQTYYVNSDATWKVSDTAPEGWTTRDFDDSSWASATSLGKSGILPWGPVLTSVDAEWLWSYVPGSVDSKPVAETRYFRKTFYMDPALTVTSEPTCTP